MNKEIEIKLKVENGELKTLLSWLKNNTNYLGQRHQIDYYFESPNEEFSYVNEEGITDAVKYLRVRLSNEQNDSVTYKHWHEDPDNPGKYLYCDEHEFEVDDGRKVMKLLGHLGYKRDIVVDKYRNVYKTEKFEIVIDEVKDLGTFVEIELKVEITDPKQGMDMIYALVKSIGINPIKIQTRGYVSMLWNPDHNFTEIVHL